MKLKKNRRKRYLIDKEFQLFFISDFLKIIISFILLMGLFLVVFYYIKYQFGESIFNNYLLIVKKGETIKVTNMFKIVAPVILVSSLIVVIFIVIYGIFYSHRIAGPIYRLKKTIESICNRNLNFTVRLRKKDKFQEIAEYLNNLITFLNQNVLILKEGSNNIRKKVIEAKKILSKSPIDKQKLGKIIDEIRRYNSELSTYLMNFKTQVSHRRQKQ